MAPSAAGCSRRQVVVMRLVGLLCGWAASTAWAVAPQSRGEPPADGAPEGAVARASACLGRENPTCIKALLPELERQGDRGVSVLFWRGMAEFLGGEFVQARATLEQVAADEALPKALRDRADAQADLAEATAELLAPAKPRSLAGGKVTAWIRPGPDEVLLGYLDTVLTKALPQLETAFGPPGAPLVLHVYPRADDLARVSGLTVQQIRTSGTIALCKYNRVMLTSPQDLVFGYAWADTVVHELVHWFIIQRGGPQVPIWMHEGLARSLQGVWRGAAPELLDRDEQVVLAAARKARRFIPLARMHPSMALLPSQDDTALAFAEVHHALAWLMQRAATRNGQLAQPLRAAGHLASLFGEGKPEAAVLQALTGLSPAAFEGAWRRDLARTPLDASGLAATPQVQLVFRGAGAPALRAASAQARRLAELGDRLAVLGRPHAAAIEYRKALAAGQQDGPLVVARLVRVLLDLGRAAEAAEYLQPALQAYAGHAPLHVLAGRLAVLQNQWRQALEALERAAWLNPYDPQVHSLSAQAHTALGQVGEAHAARARLALVE
jgi:tetratricopeptide (TPR) repeat protein